MEQSWLVQVGPILVMWDLREWRDSKAEFVRFGGQKVWYNCDGVGGCVERTSWGEENGTGNVVRSWLWAGGGHHKGCETKWFGTGCYGNGGDVWLFAIIR